MSKNKRGAIMSYEEIMCCNCKKCTSKNIIEYEIGTTKVTKCKNFYPKYKFDKTGASCPFFVVFKDSEWYN